MSAMAILQQLHFGTRLSGAMLSRKWRVVVFAMAFLSLSSHRCSAGPIKIPKFVICIPGELLSFVPRSFRQPVASPTLPTTFFHLDGVNLSQIAAPPEFRSSTLTSPRVTPGILQTPRWSDERPPCRLFPGWYGSSI